MLKSNNPHLAGGEKSLVKNRSKILATNCSFVFFLGSHRLTKPDCYDLLLHDVTED